MNVITHFPMTSHYDRDLRFRAMFEGAAIGIGIRLLDGLILEANPARGRMLGYSPQELAVTHAPSLAKTLSPGRHEAPFRSWSKAMAAGWMRRLRRGRSNPSPPPSGRAQARDCDSTAQR